MAQRRRNSLKRSSKTPSSWSEKAGSSTASPVVSCDKDPYEFIDSQSLQPDTQPSTKAKLHADSTRVQRSSTDGTSTTTTTSTTTITTTSTTTNTTRTRPATTPLSRVRVSKTSNRTPSRPSKTLPRFLSKDEELEQGEFEQLQRALEASLLEKEAEDRKWRRIKRQEIKEKDEQARIMQQAVKEKQKLEHVNISRPSDSSEGDLSEIKEITFTSEKMDSTQPFPTTSSVAMVISSGARGSKKVKVSVNKLNLGSLRSTKAGQIQNESGSETSDFECVEKDSIIAPGRHALREGSTPPLSQEAPPDSHKVGTLSSTDLKQQRSVAACDGKMLSKEEKEPLPQESGTLAQSKPALDVGPVETLMNSSNLDTKTPSSISSSMPFKVVDNLEPTPDIPVSRSNSNVSIANERVHSSTELPETTIPDSPSQRTESCLDEESLQRSKPRSGGLSLSRKKRKRMSMEKVVFEEVEPPLRVPLVKRIRSDVAMVTSPSGTKSKSSQSDGDESMDIKMSSCNPEPSERDCSGGTSLSVCVKPDNASKSLPSLTATLHKDSLQTTSNFTNKSDSVCQSPAPQSTLPGSVKKMHSDLHVMNPNLPSMFCPPGNSPTEYTPLIIHRLNSYFAQLREAQSKVLTRLKWGKPVKMASTRQLSLDFGRRTRRSRNADKTINVSYLVLPKREASNTLERGESVTRKSLEKEVFTLWSDSEKSQEDTELPTQQSKRKGQEEQSVEMIEDSQIVPSLTVNDIEMEAASVSNYPDTGGQSVTSVKAPDSVDKTDIILLDTQLEEQTNTTRQASPSQLSVTSPRSPATLPKSRRSSHGFQKDLAKKDTEKAKATQEEDPLPLTWLNSRVQGPSSKPTQQRKNTPRQKLPTKKKTPGTRRGRKPKSAATRMILEFSHNSPLDRDDAVKSSSSRDPSPQAHSNTSDESIVHRRSTAAKGNQKKLSISSSDEPEQESGVIDLTSDTQLSQPTSTTTSKRRSRQLSPPITSRNLRRRGLQEATCPLCSRKFHPSLIELHASQCSDKPNFRTKQSASRGGTRRSYQPTLHQLQAKEKEMATKAGEDIDSDSDVEQLDTQAGVDADSNERGGSLLEELSTALEEGTTHGKNLDGPSTPCLPPSAMETRIIPSEDGGFIIDESTISDSPIRTFTKISDMEAKDRERYQNQFKVKNLRKKPSGASDTAWSSDFGDLAQPSRVSKGRSKQRSDWTRKRGKGNFAKGRGRYKRRPRN